MADAQKWQEAPLANKVIALLAMVGLPLFFAWQCAGFVLDSDSEPRSRPTPQEQRELEQAKRTVETTCGLWWDGVLDLPDHQAQVCIDGGYGR